MQEIAFGGLKVAQVLYDFINEEALPGSGVGIQQFWAGLEAMLEELAPRNRALLAKRERMQEAIDDWHRQRSGQRFDLAAYKDFLRQLGYLVLEAGDFEANTAGVDPEIAVIAGPQLVVPVTNARYAVNAANARWGSLYDALYGTDAIPDAGTAGRGKGYDPKRGEQVIGFARNFLDGAAPLAKGSHAEATRYTVENGQLSVGLADGSGSRLATATQFAGYQGDPAKPSAVLLGGVEMWRGDRRSPRNRCRPFRLAVPQLRLHSSVSTSRSSNRTGPI